MVLGRKTYLGLDIGTKELKAVEVKVKGSHIQVCKAGIKQLQGQVDEGNNPESLAAAIGGFWQEFSFRSKRIIISLGGPSVFYRILSLPPLGAADLRRALQWELEDYFPISAQEAVFDFCPLEIGSKYGGGQDYYLVVAAPRTTLDVYLAALDLAGLEAGAVEPEPLALLRSWGGLQRDSLLLIFKDSYTTIALVAKGRLLFARSIPGGLGVLKEDLIKNGIRRGKLTRECRSTLTYFQTGDSPNFLPEEIVVYKGENCGSLDGILTGLEEALSLPVCYAPPPDRGLIWLPRLSEEKRSFLAVSIGLSLREVRKAGGSY